MTDAMGPVQGDRATRAREPLSASFHESAQKLLKRYPPGQEQSALLPLLYLVQSEHGFVSPEGMAECARILGISRAQVMAVATFYTMFKREPQGRWLVSVCTQPSCALAGGGEIMRRLGEELGVGNGGTTEDGAVSLEEVECLCACDGAPVVSVNYENYEGKSPDEIVELVRALREGGEPPPGARGDVPRPFDDVNKEMAGSAGPLPVARGGDDRE